MATATASYQERLDAANEAAARRINARADDRAKNIEMLAQGGIAAANPSDRINKRLDRLARYIGREQLPITPAEVPEEHEPLLGSVPMRRFKRKDRAAEAG